MKMSQSVSVAALLVTCAALCACQHGGVHAVGASDTATTASTIDQIKALEGEWVIVKTNGEVDKDGGTITFKTGSAGSSVREIMFAGSGHEMTNMYHMNGGEMMMTHYCAAGNQPRMRTVVATPGHIELKTESVTNLATLGTEYMGELTLDMADSNTLKQTWTSIENGKPTTQMVFELRRK